VRKNHPMKPETYRVDPGSVVDLNDWSTRGNGGFDGDKESGQAALVERTAELTELQQMLYADGRHKVLLVLQGMDTSGKDGTIKHVFANVNPMGVHVVGFKRPTTLELAHDYLWRVHAATPVSGHITIFNRSHYEDVLVVRVHELVDEQRWQRRYGHINDFERLLADEGTTVVKCFLHISHDEQRARLQERIDQPDKRWKFEHGDLDERLRWDDYQTAYNEALSRTSTDHAPWYVVPADRKWYRNLVISTLLVSTLRGLDLRYPPDPEGLDGLVVT
jgi:PPK2 family polyphosphate:nucleotide phosphotransferase